MKMMRLEGMNDRCRHVFQPKFHHSVTAPARGVSTLQIPRGAVGNEAPRAPRLEAAARGDRARPEARGGELDSALLVAF